MSTSQGDRIAELQRELTGNPESRQFYQLGELLRRQGRAFEAAEVLRRGLVRHPRYVAAWVSLGRAKIDVGDPEGATGALNEAITLDSQNPVAWRLLGEARLAAGKRPEALEALRHALLLAPGDEVLQAAVDTLAAEPWTARTPAPAAPAAAPTAPAGPFGEASVEPAVPMVEPAGADVFALPAAAPPSSFEDEPFGGLAALPAIPLAVVDDVFAMPAELVPAAPVGQPPSPEAAAPVITAEVEPLFAAPVVAPALPLAPEVIAAAPAAIVTPLAEAAAEVPVPVAELPAPTAVSAAPREGEPTAAPAALAGEPVRGVPVVRPTITLARLFIQQEDHASAITVLERLLEADGDNQEARDLLALVHDMEVPLPDGIPPLSVRERKIAALQRWLASLTLARERVVG